MYGAIFKYHYTNVLCYLRFVDKCVWCVFVRVFRFFGGKVKNVIFALEKDKQAERF